jgi:predicted N-formylglutamate amidohydrolase
MSHDNVQIDGVSAAAGETAKLSSVVLVCEHASHHIPTALEGLGLSQADVKSHAAWDLGALAVAQHMARHLDASLIVAKVSRLVYDCNRPPTAPDAMPARSEVIEVPGNRDLTTTERNARIKTYYRPFQTELHHITQQISDPIIVTVHSFTPIYHGKLRAVEIGILHDSDTRLADAMLDKAAAHTTAKVERNQPYGPDDGVTHTLKEHAIKDGYPNVMLEIRNDLIATTEQQKTMADMLSKWLADAFTQLRVSGDVRCRA